MAFYNTEQLERFAAAIMGVTLGALLVGAGSGSVAIVTTALGVVPISIMLVLVVKGIGD